jgi:hypothetical protein
MFNGTSVAQLPKKAPFTSEIWRFMKGFFLGTPTSFTENIERVGWRFSPYLGLSFEWPLPTVAKLCDQRVSHVLDHTELRIYQVTMLKLCILVFNTVWLVQGKGASHWSTPGSHPYISIARQQRDGTQPVGYRRRYLAMTGDLSATILMSGTKLWLASYTLVTLKKWKYSEVGICQDQ